MRFEYGADTNYGTDTPWVSSYVTAQTFGKVISGLTNGVTYHFRVQAQNSEGTVVSGNDVSFTTAPPAPQSWVSPTGYADPDGVWQDPTNAFDDELASFARTYHNINANPWSSYLYLTHAPLQCDWVRFMGHKAGSIDAAEVDIFDGTQWTMVYQGDFTDSQWMEVNFPQTVVSQARIRYHVADSNQGLYWELMEFDFHTAGLPRAPGWVSPTSGHDRDGVWVDIPKAFDGNVDSYAQDWSNRVGDGSPLELDLDCPIHCNRIRVNADFGYGIVDAVRVEVLKDGQWTIVLNGAINNAAYTEIPFAAGQVSAMRFTYHYVSAGWVFWFYEGQFFSVPQTVVPPIVQTVDATSVEANSAILHGKVIDDGGDLVQYRFEYGLDTTYGIQTPWTGSVQSGNVFGAMISNLMNGQTYHFHVQAQNSTGMIVSGADDSFTTAPIDPNVWITPTGSASSGSWENVPLAFDDQLSTFARDLHNLGDNAWSDYIYLTHAAMNVSGIRLQAKADAYIDQMEVGLSNDGTNWSTVYSGAFADQQWLKVPFDPIVASQFRLRFHVNGTVGEYFQLYEFNFTGNRALAGPFAVADSYTTNSGQMLTVAAPGVLTNDTDPDNLTLMAIKLSDPANGTLTLTADGSFVYVPNANFAGTDAFTYKANNGTYDSNVAMVSVTVVGQNGPPVFTNLQPGDGSWVNTAQPVVSADILGTTIDYRTLDVGIVDATGGNAIALAGLTQAVSPNHFVVQVPYDLREGTYQISALVTDLTGDTATANATFRIDLTNPVISGLPDFLSTSNQAPSFTATYSDVPSGIDVASIKLFLDNVDVTALSMVTASSISFTPATNLSFGSHTLILTVKDVAKNTASVTSNITIIDPNADVTPPVFGVPTPADGGFVSCVLAQPGTLSINYNDTQSGVNPNSVQVQIDGQAVILPPGAATSGNVTVVLPSNLAEGPHTWSVSIADYAGNGPVVFTAGFAVDDTPPVLVNMSPVSEVSDDSSPLTAISAVFDDGTGAGVDWSSLSVVVNGVDLSSSAVSSGSSFTLSLSQPIAGPATIVVAVKDLAGNLTQTVVTRTTALSDFGIQTGPGVYSDINPPNFAIPYQAGATSHFRVAYAPGIDPSTFSVQGLAATNVDATHNDGFIYFDVAEFLTSYANTVKYQIKDTTGAFFYEVDGKTGFYDASLALTISAQPTGTVSNAYQAFSFSVTSGSPLISVSAQLNGSVLSLPLFTSYFSPSFSFSYTPATQYLAGTIPYSVSASDALGNQKTVTGSFYVNDTTPPVISGATPTGVGPFGVYRPITFSVSDLSNISTISLIVNGNAVAPTISGLNTRSASVSYTPTTPYPTGTNSYTISATDSFGNSTTPATFNFFVADVAPSITVSPAISYLNATNSKLSFRVNDLTAGFGYGIAPGQTALAYSVNGGATQTVVPSLVSASSTQISYSYPFPQSIPDGATISYTIHAENFPPAGQVNGTGSNRSGTLLVDRTLPVASQFTVDGVLETSGSVLPINSNLFVFQVSDSGSGLVAITAALYDVNNFTYLASKIIPLSPPQTAPQQASLRLSDFGTTLSNNGVYYLDVFGYDAAGNQSETIVHYTTNPDGIPPTITLQQFSSTNYASTTTGTVRITDTQSGIDPSKVLISVDGTTPVPPITIVNQPSLQYATISFAIPTSVSNGPHTLMISAVDEAKNTATFSRAFSLSRPSINITRPANNTTVTNFNVQVNIEDDDFELNQNTLVFTLDEQPISLAQPSIQANPPQLSISGKLPVGTINGSHTLGVSIIDAGGFTSPTASTSFTLQKATPPAPVISNINASVNTIVITGPIPVSPADLVSLQASVQGGNSSVNFDQSTMTWTVTIMNTGSAQAQLSCNFQDADGLSSPPLTTTQSFATRSIIQPLPPTVTPAPGSVPSDGDENISVYWDFSVEDVAGVSPRNWLPCTKNAGCNITGKVLGGTPPYNVSVSGSGCASVSLQFPTAQFHIPLSLTEGPCTGIQVAIKDSNNHQVTSFSRSIYLDTKSPNQPWQNNNTVVHLDFDGTAGLFGELPDLSGNDYNTGLYGLTNLLVDEDNTGSGITQMNLTVPSTSSISFALGYPQILIQHSISAQVPRPNGTLSSLQHGDIYTLNETGNNRTLTWPDGKYTINFPMKLTIADGAGNSSDMSGMAVVDASSSYDSVLPNYMEADRPYFAGAEDVIHRLLTGMGPAISLNGIDILPVYLAGEVGSAVDVGRFQPQVGILRQHTPGPYTFTMTDTTRSIDYSVPALTDQAMLDLLRARADDIYNQIIAYPATFDVSYKSRMRVRVYRPQLLIDENNDGKTTDEDQQRQSTLGVVMPISDSFNLQNKATNGAWTPDFVAGNNTAGDKSLRLVTFDKSIAYPRPSVIYSPDGDWAFSRVTLSHSPNVRLWKTNVKSAGNLIAPTVLEVQHGDPNTKVWDFSDDASYQDFTSLNGRMYVECLPDIENPYSSLGQATPMERFIEIRYGDSVVHIHIHAVSDKNEGIREGDTSVAVGGPASVNLTSGALNCAWPIANSGSVIIPDVWLYYSSRDDFSVESSLYLYYPRSPRPNFSSPNYIQSLRNILDTNPSMGEIGRHFHHNLEMHLVRSARYLTLVDMDGRRITYTPNQALTATTDETTVTWTSDQTKGDFSTIIAVTQTVRGNQRSCYVLLRPAENRQYVFDRASGKLLEIRDTNDNVATLEYDEYAGSRGQLLRVVDNRGIFVQFDNHGQFITSQLTVNSGVSVTSPDSLVVTDPLGRKTKICRTGISGPLGTYGFSLSPSNRIVSFTNESGSNFVVNPNGSVSGDASETSDTKRKILVFQGGVSVVQDDPATVQSTTFGVTYSVLRTKDSRTLKFDYNFPSKSATKHEYNDGANDPARDTTIAYDPQFNIWTSQQFSTGSYPIELKQEAAKGIFGRLIASRSNMLKGTSTFTYDSTTGLLATSTDPDRHSFAWNYKAITNPRYLNPNPNYLPMITTLDSSVDGKQDVTQYGYTNGFLSSVKDSVGKTGYSNFDSFGVPQHMDGPRTGYSQDVTLDAYGRPSSLTENGSDSNGAIASTRTFKTDPLGQVWEVDLPDGRIMKQFFDQRGHLICTQGPLLTDAEKAAAQAANVTLSDGGTSSMFFNELGQMIESNDPDGRFASRDIDELGRTNAAVDSSSGETDFSVFDAFGMPKYTMLPSIATNGARRQVTTFYDLIGRTIVRKWPGQVDGQDRAEIWQYNEPIFQVTYTDPRGTLYTTTLLSSGRAYYSEGPEKYLMTPYYDNNGVMIGMERQGLGRVVSDLNQHGMPMNSKINGMADLDTVYQRDAGDAVTQIQMPGGIIQVNAVDNLGRTGSTTLSNELMSSTKFRASGAYWVPVSVTDHQKAVTTVNAVDGNYLPASWTTVANTIRCTFNNGTAPTQTSVQQTIPGGAHYFASGNADFMTDAAGNHSSVLYDGLLRPVGTIDQDNIGPRTALTASGFIESRTDERGNTTTPVYDPQTGFLTKTYLPDGRLVTYSTFDLNGNPKFVNYFSSFDSNGGVGAPFTYTYTYDLLNRPKTIADPAQHKVTYDYANSGAIEKITDAASRTTEYKQDGAGRTTKITVNPGTNVTCIKFADAARTVTTTYPDGRVKTVVNNTQGRLASMQMSGQGTLTYTYNPTTGDLTSIKDSNGKVTGVTCDDLHRPVLYALPLNHYTATEYDENSYVTASIDPKGQRFVFANFQNGRHNTIGLDNGGATPTNLGSYSWAANTPTSDGTTTWSLDGAGRVATCGPVTYTYAHPLGLLTNKTYGNAVVNYSYDANDPYLKSIDDGNASLTFNNRTADGRPLDATYSNGVKAHWDYAFGRYISSMSYKQGGTVLYQVDCPDVDAFGARHSVNITPTGEKFSYAYNANRQLFTETRKLQGQPDTSITYGYDSVGNRATRTTMITGPGNSSKIDTFNRDDLYQLRSITSTDGSRIDFDFDLNGNTKSKTVSGVTTVIPMVYTLRYSNQTGSDKQCGVFVDGQAAGSITLPQNDPTSSTYQSINLNLNPQPVNTIELRIADSDMVVNGGTASISIDVLILSKGTKSILYEAENATLSGVSAAADPKASNQQAVMDFGHALSDSIKFTITTKPQFDPNYSITYTWETMNRLKDTTRKDSTNTVTDTGHWDYVGGIGWELSNQQVTRLDLNLTDKRDGYVYGYGGEILSEKIPAVDGFAGANRTYINSGVDHILWSHDDNAVGTNFFLEDVNGSVFGITYSDGLVVERMRHSSYGRSDFTSANSADTAVSTIGNRMGFQGLQRIAEFDFNASRNRQADPERGEFLSADPVGGVGGDKYSIEGHDPVNRSDPMGTKWVWITNPKEENGGHWEWQYPNTGSAQLDFFANYLARRPEMPTSPPSGAPIFLSDGGVSPGGPGAPIGAGLVTGANLAPGGVAGLVHSEVNPVMKTELVLMTLPASVVSAAPAIGGLISLGGAVLHGQDPIDAVTFGSMTAVAGGPLFGQQWGNFGLTGRTLLWTRFGAGSTGTFFAFNGAYNDIQNGNYGGAAYNGTLGLFGAWDTAGQGGIILNKYPRLNPGNYQVYEEGLGSNFGNARIRFINPKQAAIEGVIEAEGLTIRSGSTGSRLSPGRLGNATTQAQLERIATLLKDRGWTIVASPSRGEYFIQGANGGTEGGVWVDLVARHPSGKMLFINTVDVAPNAHAADEFLAIQRAQQQGVTIIPITKDK